MFGNEHLWDILEGLIVNDLREDQRMRPTSESLYLKADESKNPTEKDNAETP